MNKLEKEKYLKLRAKYKHGTLPRVIQVDGHKRVEKSNPPKKDTERESPIGQTLKSNHQGERAPERENKQDGNLDTTKKTKKGRKRREQKVFQIPLYLKPLKIPSKPFVRA